MNHVSPRPQNAILNKSNEYVYLTRYNVTLARLRGSVTAVIELGQSFVLRWLLCCSTHTDISNRIQHIRKVFRATYFFFIRTSEWVLKLLCTQRMQNKGELLIFNALFCERIYSRLKYRWRKNYIWTNLLSYTDGKDHFHNKKTKTIRKLNVND